MKLKELYTSRTGNLGQDIRNMLDEMVRSLCEEEDDLPDASPLQLLSKNDYKKMNAYLKEKFGCLLQYIDENYVALLIALQQYEDIDLDAKILKHIADNVAHR